MNVLEKINDIARKTSNAYLVEAKGNGKKTVGYFCSYIPEELIHAAGMIPYRMRVAQSKGTTLGDTYFAPTICSFVRQCFDKALRGDFDFLDGVIFMNGCDHNRRMYDNWRYADIKPDFLYMLSVPHVLADPGPDHFLTDLKKLKKELETRFDVEITDAALTESIKLYNKKRELLARIYESRKQQEVPIKGSEVLSIMLAITAIPVEDAITLLEEVIREMEGRVVSTPEDLRILISANCMEEIDHLQLIEEMGAVVVADKICLGSSHFDTLVEEAGDPLSALSHRYLKHLSCPRMMDDTDRRIAFVFDQVDKYHADAIIAERMEFCTLMAGEIFIYKKEAQKVNVPILSMDLELYGGSTGQIKTRIQAFFEKVRNIKTS